MGTLHHPEHLNGVDPRLVRLAETWAAELQFDIAIIEGVRSEATALENYAKGRTTPGPHAGEKGYPPLGLTVTEAKDVTKTPHGHAGAIDAMPLINGRIVWDERAPEWPLCSDRLVQMQEVARRYGLKCGADFPKRDLDHFEVPNWRDLPLAR